CASAICSLPMRSLRVISAPSASASAADTCCGVYSRTCVAETTSKYSPSLAMTSSNRGCDTHTRGRDSAMAAVCRRVAGNERSDRADIAALGAVAQGLVDQHQRHHRLGDRSGADADAGIVAAGGDHFGRLALDV